MARESAFLPIKTIVVADGGPAGWMTAIALSARFPEKHVTVVDSKAVGPIGVGEGATGVGFEIVTDLQHGPGCGEFFRRCDPAFKPGIWYKCWQGIYPLTPRRPSRS